MRVTIDSMSLGDIGVCVGEMSLSGGGDAVVRRGDRLWSG